MTAQVDSFGVRGAFGETLVEALMPLCVWENEHRMELEAHGLVPAAEDLSDPSRRVRTPNPSG